MKMLSKRNKSILDSDETRKLARFLVGNSPIDNPDQLVELSLSLSLGPLYLHHLKCTNSSLKDSQLTQKLETEAKSSAFLHLKQEQAMLEVNLALSNGGIRCVWIKGATLAHVIYPEPYLRTKSDLDCIVDSKEFERAVQILLNMNYASTDDTIYDIDDIHFGRLDHHIKLQHKSKMIYLELHRHLLGFTGPKHIPPSLLNNWLKDSVSLDIYNQTLLTLRPEHHFLYLCAHAFLQHGQENVGIRELLDMYLLAKHYELDWDKIISEAVDLNWIYLLEFTLKFIQDCFGASSIVGEQPLLNTNRRIDQSLDNIIRKQHQQFLGESVLDYVAKLSTKERLRTAWSIAFPSKKYMRRRYKIHQKSSVFPYYVYRVLLSYRLFTKIKSFLVEARHRLSTRLRTLFDKLT